MKVNGFGRTPKRRIGIQTSSKFMPQLKNIEIHYINEKTSIESADFSQKSDGLYIFDNIIGDMGKFLFLKHTQLLSPKDMHEIKV